MFDDPRDVLLAPVISEKSYGLLDENKYTFEVHPQANKTQIKIAVEKVFNVKVTDVNTLNRQGKRKRTRYGYGTRRSVKRAIVTLRAGDRIDVFGRWSVRCTARAAATTRARSPRGTRAAGTSAPIG
jgi:large subunit ribosomal protein L23